MGKRICSWMLLLAMVLIGCSNEIDPPSGVSNLPPEPEIPRGLTAAIGDSRVDLTWTVSRPGDVDHYVVYYSDSAPSNMTVFGTADQPSQTVDGLANGQRYFFRVAAVDRSGLEGNQSPAISAVPGVFSLSILGGALYTNVRSVTVNITAPLNARLVQLSEDSGFAGAHWQTYTSSKTFELSEGDGTKTVYAGFQMESGGTSLQAASDDIILDRKAVILSVAVMDTAGAPLPPGTVLGPGDTVHFVLTTAEDGAEAMVTVDGLGEITLNDRGINGDTNALDSVYEADYIIPDETELTEALVVGRFLDAAGNQAPEAEAPQRLTATSPPDPVVLWGYAVSSLEIQLQWTQSQADDFSSYRLFRADSAMVADSDSVLVETIVKASDAKYRDGDLEAETEYTYWVIVDDTHGNSTPSARLSVSTQANQYPDTVTILAVFTGDSLEARISWPQPAAAADFEAYYILRDTASFDNYADSLAVDFISNQQSTSYMDSDLPDTGMYYYRVYVVDRQGLKSPSNIASVYIPR